MAINMLNEDIFILNERHENLMVENGTIDSKRCCRRSGKDNQPIDIFMCDFCEDALNVLKEYDFQIKAKMLSGFNKNFYNYDVKGIGVWSITEPILKYLIYTNLLDKYKMLPERDFYGDKRLLDLAVFYKDITDEEIYDDKVAWAPDIAIEMKWAGTRKDGHIYKGLLNQIHKDILKMNDLNDIENKYLMFFDINYDLSKTIEPLTHEDTIYDSIDKRKFRKKSIKFVYSNCFQTMDFNGEVNGRFFIHLYKIVDSGNVVK